MHTVLGRLLMQYIFSRAVIDTPHIDRCTDNCSQSMSAILLSRCVNRCIEMAKKEKLTYLRQNCEECSGCSLPTCGCRNVVYKIDEVVFCRTFPSQCIIQICHASVGNMMECFPEGGWFSRGRSPRENHPPEGRHSIMLPTLAWHICFIIPNKPHL